MICFRVTGVTWTRNAYPRDLYRFRRPECCAMLQQLNMLARSHMQVASCFPPAEWVTRLHNLDIEIGLGTVFIDNGRQSGAGLGLLCRTQQATSSPLTEAGWVTSTRLPVAIPAFRPVGLLLQAGRQPTGCAPNKSTIIGPQFRRHSPFCGPREDLNCGPFSRPPALPGNGPFLERRPDGVICRLPSVNRE